MEILERLNPVGDKRVRTGSERENNELARSRIVTACKASGYGLVKRKVPRLGTEDRSKVGTELLGFTQYAEQESQPHRG